MSFRVLVSVAVVLAASLAFEVAAGADDRVAALAVELFNEGKDLERRGDFAAACQKFGESAKLDARVGTFARLAQCEEKLGLALSARLHWGQARDLARSLHDPRAEHADQEYARVDALVPKLRLVLAGPTPPGLTLAIDEDEMGPAAIGPLVPVAPGQHTIRAAAPGMRPFVISVSTQADGVVTPVKVDLVEARTPEPARATADPGLQAEPVAPSSPTSWRNQDSRRPWTVQKTFALASGGLGVLALGVGSYFGLQSFSKWSEAKTQCGAGCGAGDSAARTKADAERAATDANIAFGTAGVLLAAAGVLWFTAPRDPAKQARPVRILPFAGSATGVIVAGRFEP